MANEQKFAVLKRARRVWAVASVHGEASRLVRLHGILVNRLEPGDRIVYLGNLVGCGPDSGATLDAVIRLRGQLLARPRAFNCDLAYLRGRQEEMWQKLMQLQFASDPRAIVQWMLDQGVGATLAAYDISPEQAMREAAMGPVYITRWTSRLREAMRSRPGHFELLGALRRAAYTEDRSLLLVSSGVDVDRPLEEQKDAFWWGSGGFSRDAAPFGEFGTVVRGFCLEHPGLETAAHRITVDAGCGFGGALIAACITPEGEVVDHIEA